MDQKTLYEAMKANYTEFGSFPGAMPSSIGFSVFELKKIPDWIGNLKRLKPLQFYAGEIFDLPEDLKYHPVRRIMITGAGRFNHFPEILSEIPSLSELHWIMNEDRFQEIYRNSS
ncbi:MAG: hypothetical protein Q6373_006605 [Candidatus Sigynarchaeota archaeon]